MTGEGAGRLPEHTAGVRRPVMKAVEVTFPLTLERFADRPELEVWFMRDALPASEADLWTDDQP